MRSSVQSKNPYVYVANLLLNPILFLRIERRIYEFCFSALIDDVHEPLSRLLRLELIFTPVVLAASYLLLRLIADIAVRPLDQIATAARRTADGHWGERLRPDPADTRLFPAPPKPPEAAKGPTQAP